MTFLRLVVTWEAIEPVSEGVYHTAYLYVRALVRMCGRHGLSVLIDPHQDAWSRWTGGDGAPWWTLERLGLDPESFYETRAAVMHTHEARDARPFPRMARATNYMLFAAATMFTLFFAGDRYAPATAVDGVPVQEWLQGAYVRAIQRLAARLRGERNVPGFEAMNEPSAGWAGRCSAARPLTEYHAGMPLGRVVSPWDAIRLASGASLDVPVLSAPFAYSHTERAPTRPAAPPGAPAPATSGRPTGSGPATPAGSRRCCARTTWPAPAGPRPSRPATCAPSGTASPARSGPRPAGGWPSSRAPRWSWRPRRSGRRRRRTGSRAAGPGSESSPPLMRVGLREGEVGAPSPPPLIRVVSPHPGPGGGSWGVGVEECSREGRRDTSHSHQPPDTQPPDTPDTNRVSGF